MPTSQNPCYVTHCAFWIFRFTVTMSFEIAWLYLSRVSLSLSPSLFDFPTQPCKPTSHLASLISLRFVHSYPSPINVQNKRYPKVFQPVDSVFHSLNNRGRIAESVQTTFTFFAMSYFSSSARRQPNPFTFWFVYISWAGLTICWACNLDEPKTK